IYQVRVINNEKIRLRAPVNLQQVLSTELGFRFSNDLTLGTSDVQLMGMSGRNVKILLDGVPMVDRSDTRESLNQIDVNSVDRIEIVEGPMSVMYGTDALAGVINIITKKNGEGAVNVTARLQEETVGSEYTALDGKGSHNQYAGISWQSKQFNALAGITKQGFGGWKIGAPTSTVLSPDQWLPKEQLLVNAKLGYKGRSLSLWYRIDGVGEKLSSRSAMNENNYKGKLAEYITKRYTNQLQGEWLINDKLTANGVVAYSDLNRRTRTTIHDFTTNNDELTTAPGEQDIAKFNSTLFRGIVNYRLTKKLSFQPGFEINLDGASGARINGSPSITDVGVFISAEWRAFNGVSFKPGIRVIENSVYNAPPVIPSLNASFSLNNDLDLRLGYANGFRAPALRELFYDFFDASHSIMGNPDLKAERSNSFTGSLVWSNNGDALKVRTTASGFYNRFFNRIDYGQSATDASVTTLINVGLFKTTGGSIENTIIWGNFNVNAGLSYIGRYNRYVENEIQLGKLPEFVWSPEISANILYHIPKVGADLSIAYKFTGSRPSYELYTMNGANEARLVKTGSFSLADLMINKKLLRFLTVNGGIKNIFDITQLNNTATSSAGAHSSGGSIPLSYGRSYVLGLSFSWTKI
ncbi:MAG: TonB-dependent receptor, partial [Pedobacter sp.]